MMLKNDHFALANFEGSIDFLLCLIQKEEIDIYDIPIQELIEQFLLRLRAKEEHLDQGADFIGAAAHLVWLKSRTLLPKHEQEDASIEERVEDPHFEIIHHLIDYCRFKAAAKELTSRQEKQQACYFRGIDPPEWKKPLGIDHVSLDELSLLFTNMISKAAQIAPQIQEENWRVCDKIRILRGLLNDGSPFSLANLFSNQQTRQEMIVIFLALLELMKVGELAVGREPSSRALLIYPKNVFQ
ncbi:MAG: segregation and condensation protein A [Parachlamydiaceae bacterium]